MLLVLTDYLSLDSVVQPPGGAEEDPSGGFAHGGWSMPCFDPEVMGAAVDALLARSDALLFGRRTWQGWPRRVPAGPATRSPTGWGSATLARQLVEHDLVDEYVLLIEPVLLGGGKRVFPQDGRMRRLRLVDTAPAGTGVLICTYRTVRD